MLIDFPGLLEKLDLTPNGIFSGKLKSNGSRQGIFLCYRLPALDAELNQFTLESGVTKWYFVSDEDKSIIEDPADIDTQRQTILSQDDLISSRAIVRDFIKNSYEKKLNVPLDAPKPKLICWMEVGNQK